MLFEENYNYKGWNKCIKLTSGGIELIITTEVGPRIISCRYGNGKNLFHQFGNQMGKKGSREWLMYGGHRFWHGPESMPRSYCPDNEPVEYEIKYNRLKLTGHIEPTTNMQKELEIQCPDAQNHIKVIHRLINKNLWPIKASAWAISAMAVGGFAIVPQEPFIAHSEYLLPVRSLALWGFTDMKDKRWDWGSKYIMLVHDPDAENSQKAGFSNTLGWAAYAFENSVFLKRYYFCKDKLYTDMGCNTEIYTDADIIELETLGPFEEIQPLGFIEHTEHWFLYDIDIKKTEDDVQEKIEPLVSETEKFI